MASALLVLPAVHGQGTFELLYNLKYTRPVYPSGSTILINNFTNGGTLPERVTGVTVITDFGTFNASSGLPLYLAVGQKLELNMTAQIPSGAYVGTHAVRANAYFQYYYNSQWITPSQSPFLIEGGISITSNPFGSAAEISYLVLVAIATLFLVVYLAVRMRPKAGAIPPPSYAPLSPN